ncbi:MAG TPA: TA system VapC family ribonuclease toxin [Polyangiaceae bacterium]|nr:TA system VapC family ribonuclease toxin [Polyangiaceae bacterium]
MIAVDTNVLVYAHRREAPEHEVALGLMKRLSEGDAGWAIPWPCLFEFWSVVTNPRIWKADATIPEAAALQIDAWLGSPTVRLLSETEEFWSILRRVVERPRVRGPVVHDARIAALCLANGVETLLSRDRDFSLFPDLPIEDPFSPRKGRRR